MGNQIFLTGIVSEWMAEDARQAITESTGKLDVFISSYGGSVNKGLEIANLIQAAQSSGKDIHTHNLAHADSIATAIFLAAKKENRHIVENSMMFIHEPRFIIYDEVTKGDADKMAQELELQTKRLADFYVKNIEGLTSDEALSLMAGETNLNAAKMLEFGIVSEVMPNFEIAAQRSLIINKNNSKMGLFNKKQPINALNMKDGSVMLHEGELKTGVEVQKVGELVDLQGEHVDGEGRTIKVGANNIVTEIVALVIEPVVPPTNSNGDILSGVAALLVEQEAKFDAKIEALRKTGSNAQVPKVDNSAANLTVVGDQASAKLGIKAQMDKIQATKRKNQAS